MLCGLKGKPRLGTQELENVLDNEGIGSLIGVIGVTTSRVEREASLMENIASRALDMASVYLLKLIFLFSMEGEFWLESQTDLHLKPHTPVS